MQNNENVAGKSAFLLLSLINVFYIIVLLIGKSQPKEKSPKICEYSFSDISDPKPIGLTIQQTSFKLKFLVIIHMQRRTF